MIVGSDEVECRYFFTDDKFYPVTSYLQSLGLRRRCEMSKSNIIYTNLKNVDFSAVDGKIINHFKGSQHLSNKAFLAYHLLASSKSHLMPQQWSSAFQSIPELINMLVGGSNYVLEGECDVNEFSGIKTDEKTINPDFLNLKYASILAVNAILDTIPFWYAKISQMSSKIEKIEDESVLGRCISDLVHLKELLSKFQQGHSVVKQSMDLWIVKPVGLSCGENITVVRSLIQTLKAVEALKFKCIVQKYIERPILVRNHRKFDIRQWILVTNLNPLQVYGFSECYARLSARQYNISDDVSLQDETIHLCNHAIQKKTYDARSASAVESSTLPAEEPSDVFCDTMMTQAQLDRELTDIFNSQTQILNEAWPVKPVVSVFESIILPQIKTISVDVIQSTRDKLSVHGKGYEWLGLDLMVCADTWNTLLLEVNVSPDISYSTSVTARLVPSAISNMFKLLGVVTPDTVVDCQETITMACHNSNSFHDIKDACVTSTSLIPEPILGHSNDVSSSPTLVTSDLNWINWYTACKPETLQENRSFARLKKQTRDFMSPLAPEIVTPAQIRGYESFCVRMFGTSAIRDQIDVTTTTAALGSSTPLASSSVSGDHMLQDLISRLLQFTEKQSNQWHALDHPLLLCNPSGLIHTTSQGIEVGYKDNSVDANEVDEDEI